MAKIRRFYLFVLTPNPLPNSGISGGAIKTLQTFLEFSRLDTEIHLVSCSLWHRLFNQYHIPHQYHPITPNMSFHGKLGLSLMSLFLVVKTILLFDPKPDSYIYTASDLFWDVFPAFFYRLKFGNKITWVQNIYHVYPPWHTRPGNKVVSILGHYLQKLTHRLIIAKANKILVLNDATRHYFILQGVAPSRLFKTAIGIDHRRIAKIPLQKIRYQASFLGRLDPSKGVLDLPYIWSKVVKQRPQSKLIIIGKGDQSTETKLRTIIKELHLAQNIILAGFIPDNKVTTLLKSSSLFLSPSHEEGWGIAITEAMACGLPIVCWDLPVYQEIYRQLPNFVPLNNFSLFSKKIIDLLNSPSTLKQQSQLNHQFSLQFNWSQVAKNELKFIFKNAQL